MFTKWLLPFIAVAGIGVHHSSAAFAHFQGKPAQTTHPADSADITKIAKIIEATPQQVQQLLALRQRFTAEKAHMKASKAISAEKLKQLHVQLYTSLREILSPKQLERLHKDNLVGALLGEPNHMGPMQMLEKLGLSDQQKEKVTQIFERAHKAMDEVKADGRLSPEQMKLRIEEIHTSAMQEIHTILTPDQLRRLQEFHSGMGVKKVIDP